MRIRHVTYNRVISVRIVLTEIFVHGCITCYPYCSVPNVVLTTHKQRHMLVGSDYVIKGYVSIGLNVETRQAY